jgi:hypothetical protein
MKTITELQTDTYLKIYSIVDCLPYKQEFYNLTNDITWILGVYIFL